MSGPPLLLHMPCPELDNDSWFTPRWILDELGYFDLDPCACVARRTWVCPFSYTPEDDGLRQHWQGRVFLNPPFSNVGPWIERLAAHGNGIALLPAGHDTEAWEQSVWLKANGIFLLRGRVRFTGPDGMSTRGRPRCPVALVSYGLENRMVLERFPGAGVFLAHWRIQGSRTNVRKSRGGD
jgi:hypothetical protein